jgi:hypothetical protein
LPHDDGGEYLFPEVWFAFHDGNHYHVSNAGRWNTSQSAVVAADVYELQFLGASVIGACHSGADR